MWLRFARRAAPKDYFDWIEWKFQARIEEKRKMPRSE
jgi:hypothetical protein